MGVGCGGGNRGGETGVSEGERWSFCPSWLREKEKQLVCKWMPLPCAWMTCPSLPPSLRPISPAIPSAVSGCLKGGTLL